MFRTISEVLIQEFPKKLHKGYLGLEFLQCHYAPSFDYKICFRGSSYWKNQMNLSGTSRPPSSLPSIICFWQTINSIKTLKKTRLTLASSSVSRLHPSVMQFVPNDALMKSSWSGIQMGRAKSENTICWSSLSRTIELPSTGDLTIPIIVRFCSHGARLWSLTLANRAVHFALACLIIVKVR